jgi:RNA polymerase sigma-70 factor, ECF subfamily
VDFVSGYRGLSSAELLRACADSRDEEAWTELIRRFQPVIASAVLRTARQWCEPSRSQRDDLIQDIYLKLCDDDYRFLRTFEHRHENAIYGFLRVFSANVVKDHFKSVFAVKRGAGQIVPVDEPAKLASMSGSDVFIDAVSQRMQMEKIDKALRHVTAGKDQDRKCMVFWLRHLQGFSAAEIAAIPSIGLTTEGVESMLMRLATMIRGHLLVSTPHREVKVLSRKNRSKRTGS